MLYFSRFSPAHIENIETGKNPKTSANVTGSSPYGPKKVAKNKRAKISPRKSKKAL